MAHFIKFVEVFLLLHLLGTNLGQTDEDFSSLANNDTQVEFLKEEEAFEEDEIRETQVLKMSWKIIV
jgi:hypothetical protein